MFVAFQKSIYSGVGCCTVSGGVGGVVICDFVSNESEPIPIHVNGFSEIIHVNSIRL